MTEAKATQQIRITSQFSYSKTIQDANKLFVHFNAIEKFKRIYNYYPLKDNSLFLTDGLIWTLYIFVWIYEVLRKKPTYAWGWSQHLK